MKNTATSMMGKKSKKQEAKAKRNAASQAKSMSAAFKAVGREDSFIYKVSTSIRNLSRYRSPQ